MSVTQKELADHAAGIEEREDGERIDNGSFSYFNEEKHSEGYVVSHSYPTIAHAVMPVAWHVTGAESMCLPVAGVQFRYLADGSVDALIHIHIDAMPRDGLYMFLSESPRNEALAMNAIVLSERRRIAAIAAVDHFDRFSHVASVLRAALLKGDEWAIPDLVQPCADHDAAADLKSPRNRNWAERAAAWMRRGMRAGGAT